MEPRLPRGPFPGSGQDAPGRRREQPPEKTVPGPRCAECARGNPAARVRCEVCGAELWPSAASRGIAPPATPELDLPVPAGRRPLILLLLAPLAMAAAVFLTVWLLG
ncbi:hypothetical protein [Actinoplanes sp. NPDC049265]|uniref:hypothetical protein n=1 Tax=Actinoplanes sp. NPDC049265 TaxID=3363902 RepID=UPI00371B0B89